MTSTFEGSFLARVRTLLNDASVTFAWGETPKGAPVQGKTEVVIWNAPGGEKEETHNGMSGSEDRRIQFSIFSVDPQDATNVALSLHNILDGAHGTLDNGTVIDNIAPGMQDIDGFDVEERVFSIVFDVIVSMASPIAGARKTL